MVHTTVLFKKLYCIAGIFLGGGGGGGKFFVDARMFCDSWKKVCLE